jgi:hypothetical protein
MQHPVPPSEDATDSTDPKTSRLRAIAILFIELLLALPLGWLLAQMGIGGIAWILGGLAAGVLVLHGYWIGFHGRVRPNQTARKVGLMLVGLNIGVSISHGDLTGLAAYLPLFILLTLFMLVSGGVIGLFYSRISDTNLLTAMLATVPGSVGVMASLAADYNRNVTLVSLVQILRVTTVILVIPLVARTSVVGAIAAGTGTTPTTTAPSPLVQPGLLFLALVTAGLGVLLANRLRIPAAPFFGAFMAGVGFTPFLVWVGAGIDPGFRLPSLVNLLGQLLLGITIGEYWGNRTGMGKRLIGFALMPVGLTIAAGFLAAALAMRLSGWDWLTCVLLTAPGGAPEMILVALSLKHNVEIVTAGHLVRLIAINGSLPLWIYLFRRLDQQIS